MKIACITDQHFGAKNGNIGLHDYFKKFYDDVFFPYIDLHNITDIIDLGDTFDKRKFIDYDSLDRCRSYWFDEIEKRGITLHIIVGNHCTPFKNLTSINSPDLLLGDYKSVKVYPTPTEVSFDGHTVLFVPWICQETASATTTAIKSSLSSTVFGHLELAGFEMYKGQPHIGGMTSDVFSKFNLVCSGHFHHRSSNNKIHYLGCPYEMTWADYKDPKGFHVYDTENISLTFIENPYRMFHKIYYDDSEWTSYPEHDFSQYSGTYVKLIVVNKLNAHWFDKFETSIKKVNPLDLKVENVEFSLDLEVVDGEILDATPDDTIEILHRSIDSSNIDGEKRNNLHSLFTDMYLEASYNG